MENKSVVNTRGFQFSRVRPLDFEYDVSVIDEAEFLTFEHLGKVARHRGLHEEHPLQENWLCIVEVLQLGRINYLSNV